LGESRLSIKQIEYLKWFGTICFLSAATLLSSNIEVSRWGFFIFLAGHVSLTWLFWRLKDNPMMIQNGFFIFIDAWGIYRWF
jgi:hypothetical protein